MNNFPADEWLCVTLFQKSEAKKREQLRVLHEMLGVWRAIASCPGYSVNENPNFWARVLFGAKITIDQKLYRFHAPATTQTGGTCVTLSLHTCVDEANSESVHSWLQDMCSQIFALDSDAAICSTPEF